jgi:outer membrane protein OmpA-like peptidoglycan-associated protein
VSALRRWRFASLAIAVAALSGCAGHGPAADASGADDGTAVLRGAGDRDAEDGSGDGGGTGEDADARDVDGPAVGPPDEFDLAAAGEGRLDLPRRRSSDRFDFPGVEVEIIDVPEGVEPCELGITVTNEAIRFARDSAEITAEGRHALEAVAELLAGAEVVTIVGHTSTEGDVDWNLALSERRAAAVEAVLAELLGPGTTLSSSGRGELEPLEDPDETERQRERNRRVHLTAAVEEERCG